MPSSSVAEPVGDVVAVLARQHRELGELIRGIDRQPRIGHGIEGESLRRLQGDIDELRRRFVVHEWCKLLYLWPVLRRAWPDGEALAGAARRQQRHVEELLIKFRWLNERDPRAAEVLDEVLAGMRQHVSLEQHILGRLRRTLPRQVLEQAGRKLTRKFLVPTRPHPYLPTHRWAVVVLGSVTGAADRLVDSFSFGPGGA